MTKTYAKVGTLIMQGYEGTMMSNIHYTRVGSSNG